MRASNLLFCIAELDPALCFPLFAVGSSVPSCPLPISPAALSTHHQRTWLLRLKHSRLCIAHHFSQTDNSSHLPSTLRWGLLGLGTTPSSTGLSSCTAPAAYARSRLLLPVGMLMALLMSLPDADCWFGKLPCRSRGPCSCCSSCCN